MRQPGVHWPCSVPNVRKSHPVPIFSDCVESGVEPPFGDEGYSHTSMCSGSNSKNCMSSLLNRRAGNRDNCWCADQGSDCLLRGDRRIHAGCRWCSAYAAPNLRMQIHPHAQHITNSPTLASSTSMMQMDSTSRSSTPCPGASTALSNSCIAGTRAAARSPALAALSLHHSTASRLSRRPWATRITACSTPSKATSTEVQFLRCYCMPQWRTT
jgi:hypothetical protein